MGLRSTSKNGTLCQLMYNVAISFLDYTCSKFLTNCRNTDARSKEEKWPLFIETLKGRILREG